MAVFHVLMDPALLGHDTSSAQLVLILNRIGEGDSVKGASVTEKMFGQVFASSNNYMCHKCSKLGIEGADDKLIIV